MSDSNQLDENAVCTGCGCFGAYHFVGTTLCADCYEKRGSCCPECGADDLWRDRGADGETDSLRSEAPDCAPPAGERPPEGTG